MDRHCSERSDASAGGVQETIPRGSAGGPSGNPDKVLTKSSSTTKALLRAKTLELTTEKPSVLKGDIQSEIHNILRKHYSALLEDLDMCVQNEFSDHVRTEPSTLGYVPTEPSTLGYVRTEPSTSQISRDISREQTMCKTPSYSEHRYFSTFNHHQTIPAPPRRESSQEEKRVNGEKASASSFAGFQTTAHEDMMEMKSIFKACEHAEDRESIDRLSRQHPFNYWRKRCLNMQKATWELVMETFGGAIIVSNALYIGVSASYEAVEADVPWWVNFINYLFTGLFLMELAVKLRFFGVRVYFCGGSRFSNGFDFAIVMVDVVQLILDAAGHTIGGAQHVSLLRILRLVKLARLLRLLRAAISKDLLAMMQGMVGGMPTLAWSMVLFVVIIYVAALINFEALSNFQDERVREAFSSLSLSLLTTFRCSFGDCSTAVGTPIIVHVEDKMGAWASVVYGMFVFFITVGLFNVISAIFVESTMAVAANIQYRKQHERMNDDILWSKCITSLVRRTLALMDDPVEFGRLSHNVEKIYDIEIPNDTVSKLATDETAISLFNSLDIDSADLSHLSLFLDPDNGGTIRVIDLVSGVQRLRGDPRRSDVMTVDLMVRSLQRDIATIMEKLSKVPSYDIERIERHRASLEYQLLAGTSATFGEEPLRTSGISVTHDGSVTFTGQSARNSEEKRRRSVKFDDSSSARFGDLAVIQGEKTILI